MLNHALSWNYSSIWKPAIRIVWTGDSGDGGESLRIVEPDCGFGEASAFATVLRKARAGAAPAWWAVSDRAGHC